MLQAAPRFMVPHTLLYWKHSRNLLSLGLRRPCLAAPPSSCDSILICTMMRPIYSVGVSTTDDDERRMPVEEMHHLRLQ